jgi:hypothetical protein
MENKEILEVIFDYIIPKSTEFDMISAAELINDEKESITNNPDLVRITASYSTRIIKTKKLKDQIIELFNLEKRKNLRIYNSIILFVFKLYYSNQRVLEKIGEQSSPPFPSGNILEETDLLLFEDVYLRGKVYRDS